MDVDLERNSNKQKNIWREFNLISVCVCVRWCVLVCVCVLVFNVDTEAEV